MTQAEKQTLRVLWKDRVRDFRASGMTAAAWCREQKLKTRQLGYWIPVRIDESPQPAEDGLLLHLGVFTLEVKAGFNENLLAEVVRALKPLC